MWRLNAGEVSTGVAGHLRNLGAALSHNDFAGATAIQVSRSVSQSVPPEDPRPLQAAGLAHIRSLMLELRPHLLCWIRVSPLEKSDKCV